VKRFVVALLAAGSAALAAPAHARSQPGPTHLFGPNCQAVYRASGHGALFVGTVLGGRQTRHRWGSGTFTDYRTFQGCFRSAEACQVWVADHASRHRNPPGYARCTPVFVGLNPAR
jgi:hypothetical protein